MGCWCVLFASFDAHLFDWCLASRNKSQDYRRPHFLVFIILILYLMAAYNLYTEWASDTAYFTTPKWESFWEALESDSQNSTPVGLAIEICAILSTTIADATLAWNLILVFA